MRYIHLLPTRDNKIIIVEGPDGCGKTNIAQGLSLKFAIRYFKQTDQRGNWLAKDPDTYLHELRFGERRQLDLIRQLGLDLVMDRGFPSEWVYSKVFGRNTDPGYLREVDQEYARLGTYIVVCLRNEYKNIKQDELFDLGRRIKEIEREYLEFCAWSRCECRIIYVDAFGNDLKK